LADKITTPAFKSGNAGVVFLDVWILLAYLESSDGCLASSRHRWLPAVAAWLVMRISSLSIFNRLFPR
jgi:hypothetical protein